MNTPGYTPISEFSLTVLLRCSKSSHGLPSVCHSYGLLVTSLSKVIWEEGRVAVKVSPYWLQWRAPNSRPKVPLPVDRSPNPTTCLIPGPVRAMMPNGIRTRSAGFPQCTRQTDRRTDRQTDRPTDRPRESLMTIARYASNESHAA